MVNVFIITREWLESIVIRMLMVKKAVPKCKAIHLVTTSEFMHLKNIDIKIAHFRHMSQKYCVVNLRVYLPLGSFILHAHRRGTYVPADYLKRKHDICYSPDSKSVDFLPKLNFSKVSYVFETGSVEELSDIIKGRLRRNHVVHITKNSTGTMVVPGLMKACDRMVNHFKKTAEKRNTIVVILRSHDEIQCISVYAKAHRCI